MLANIKIPDKYIYIVGVVVYTAIFITLSTLLMDSESAIFLLLIIVFISYVATFLFIKNWKESFPSNLEKIILFLDINSILIAFVDLMLMTFIICEVYERSSITNIIWYICIAIVMFTITFFFMFKLSEKIEKKKISKEISEE